VIASPARIVGVRIGAIAPLGPRGVPSAFMKSPVAGRVAVGLLGLDGDAQADMRVHGGPDKAVYAYPAAAYPAWRAAVPRHAARLIDGAMGENLTIDGWGDADVAIDFVPDELESKLEIFSMIDRMAPPKTILCTPSYALSITDLASCVYRPERCLALRGSLLCAAEPASLGLLYPDAIAQNVLAAVITFFETLGLTPQPEPDPDVPMLMKNAARVAF